MNKLVVSVQVEEKHFNSKPSSITEFSSTYAMLFLPPCVQTLSACLMAHHHNPLLKEKTVSYTIDLRLSRELTVLKGWGKGWVPDMQISV